MHWICAATLALRHRAFRFKKGQIKYRGWKETLNNPEKITLGNS